MWAYPVSLFDWAVRLGCQKGFSMTCHSQPSTLEGQLGITKLHVTRPGAVRSPKEHQSLTKLCRDSAVTLAHPLLLRLCALSIDAFPFLSS